MDEGRILIVGLGNPGAAYAGHRHNIGFMAITAMADAWRAAPWRARFQGETTDVQLGDRRALLLKPLTYMNESGRAVGEAARFFRILPRDIVILHDELDLPEGLVRCKIGGGNAGHNGLRSITAHIGNDYRRVRLGIGHPGDKSLVHAHVLSDFARTERGWVDDLCAALARHAVLLATGQDGAYQKAVQDEMQARGWTGIAPAGQKRPTN